MPVFVLVWLLSIIIIVIKRKKLKKMFFDKLEDDNLVRRKLVSNSSIKTLLLVLLGIVVVASYIIMKADFRDVVRIFLLLSPIFIVFALIIIPLLKVFLGKDNVNDFSTVDLLGTYVACLMLIGAFVAGASLMGIGAVVLALILRGYRANIINICKNPGFGEGIAVWLLGFMSSISLVVIFSHLLPRALSGLVSIIGELAVFIVFLFKIKIFESYKWLYLKLQMARTFVLFIGTFGLAVYVGHIFANIDEAMAQDNVDALDTESIIGEEKSNLVVNNVSIEDNSSLITGDKTLINNDITNVELSNTDSLSSDNSNLVSHNSSIEDSKLNNSDATANIISLDEKTHEEVMGNSINQSVVISDSNSLQIAHIDTDGNITSIDGLSDGRIVTTENGSTIIQDSQSNTIARITDGNITGIDGLSDGRIVTTENGSMIIQDSQSNTIARIKDGIILDNNNMKIGEISK